MISLEEARQIVLGACRPLGMEKVDILAACGRVIGEDVYSPRDIPARANSAKDGYALRAADVQGARASKPVELKVTETIAAGRLPRVRIGKGQAARIMTGAVIPEGADAVVCREDTQEKGQTVLVKITVPAGLEIREAGEDVRKGELVVKAGSVLRPGLIGLMASLGKSFVYVHQRPRVAILSTGDELVEIDREPPAGKIVNSNSYSLAALVGACGGIPVMLGIGRDRKAELARLFRQARQADIILSSGGVSVGDFDFVKDVMRDIGNEMHFWQVAMRPGKPLAFGSVGGVPLFGLPGNPVSVMVSFEQFARPYLLKMQGYTNIFRPVMKAVSASSIKKQVGLKHFLRVVVSYENGRYMAHLTGEQGSGILKSMAMANALMVIPEQKASVKKGEEVLVQLLDEFAAGGATNHPGLVFGQAAEV